MVLTVVSEKIIDDIIQKYGTINKLNLSCNGIQKLQRMHKLQSLEKLDLSCNDLRDVTSLADLSRLKELNLAENRIADVNCLSSLLQLSKLNLADNDLRSVHAVEPLYSLQNLEDLNLSGNLLCSSSVFPHVVLCAMPNLKILNNKSRAEWMRSSIANNNAPHMHLSSKVSVIEEEESEEESEVHVSQQQVTTLEAEIEAYERSFVSQEKCLSADAHHRSCQENSESSISGDVSAFPYEKLLRLWRKEAQKHITYNILAEKREKTLLKEFQTKELLLEDRLRSSEQKCEAVSSRLVAQQETNKRLTSTHQLQSQEFNRLSESHTLLRHQYDEIFAQQKQLRVYLEKFRRLMDRDGILSNAMMMQSTRKLSFMESRLLSATQRLSVLRSLVLQKDVHYRNTLAAAKAENGSRGKLSVILAALLMRIDEQPDEPCIAPEGEAVLRALFQQLDPHDTGTVATATLLRCIQSAPLEHLLQQALGNEVLYRRLVFGLQQVMNRDSTSDVTWGEDVKNDEQCHAVALVDRKLFREKLLGDDIWAMLPLALPDIADITASSAATALVPSAWLSHPMNAEDVPRLQQEALRLSRERAFLLKKVQMMSRTLERRAECIRDFYRDDIKMMSADLANAKAEIASLRQSEAQHKERLSSLQIERQESMLTLQRRLSELQESKLDSRSDARERHLQQQVEEAQLKCQRLESELRVVHKDMAKLEVSNKALQRDLQTHHATEEKAKQTIDLLRNDNDALVGDVARLSAENADLQSQLQEILRRHSDVQHAEIQTDIEHVTKLTSSPAPIAPAYSHHEPSVTPSPISAPSTTGGIPPSGAVLSNVSRRLKLIAEQLSAQNLNE